MGMKKTVLLFSAFMVVMRAIGEAAGRLILHACFSPALANCTKMRGGVILYLICVRRVSLALQMDWTWKDGLAWIGGGSTEMCALLLTGQTNSQWAKHLELSATVS